METRILPSHPDYEHFNDLQWMIVVATNPQMFFDVEVDVPEAERLALIEQLKHEQERLFRSHEVFWGED